MTRCVIMMREIGVRGSGRLQIKIQDAAGVYTMYGAYEGERLQKSWSCTLVFNVTVVGICRKQMRDVDGTR